MTVPFRRHARGAPALVALLAALTLVSAGTAHAGDAGHQRRSGGRDGRLAFEPRSLSGEGNNLLHPEWGAVGNLYLRLSPHRYADGLGAMVEGPSPRTVSNRIFNDAGQNIFSASKVTQWGWVWGQFLDHTIGLRESGGEDAPIEVDADDPLEAFDNDLGEMAFDRTPAAPGTGDDEPRQHVNTIDSYIDASALYGGTEARLEWLRNGRVNGSLADNAATLMLPGGYLPTADARGDAATAPEMQLPGRLAMSPAAATVAGDARTNENIALTAVHTLFAREHNRILGLLPDGMAAERKFEIARRVVGAEQQWITYNEFLPAMGLTLRPYQGYDPTVDAAISDEFAAVAFRMHSMVHGEFEIDVAPDRFTAAQLTALEAKGVGVEVVPEGRLLAVPLHLAFGNPGLLRELGLGPVLASLAGESQYANDEQVDNQLRSVLFQVPGPDTADPAGCFGAEALPECFSGVVDLAAMDVQRGRDHGIPPYNELRAALGLDPRSTFTSITGESTERFPGDGAIDAVDPMDDPHILDITALRDDDGNPLEPGTDAAAEGTFSASRRTTVAARLAAVYGDVDRIDAFTGMLAEPHLPGSELGELQHAIWADQFERLRDGDRFFYGNDPVLRDIQHRFGIIYRHTLAEVIVANTDIGASDLASDVFHAVDDEAAPG